MHPLIAFLHLGRCHSQQHSPDVAPSDCHLFRSMAHGLSTFTTTKKPTNVIVKHEKFCVNTEFESYFSIFQNKLI